MKRAFLNAEDAYRAIEEALNALEEMGEEPFRGMLHTSSAGGRSGMTGKSGTVLRDTETNRWEYGPARYCAECGVPMYSEENHTECRRCRKKVF